MRVCGLSCFLHRDIIVIFSSVLRGSKYGGLWSAKLCPLNARKGVKSGLKLIQGIYIPSGIIGAYSGYLEATLIECYVVEKYRPAPTRINALIFDLRRVKLIFGINVCLGG